VDEMVYFDYAIKRFGGYSQHIYNNKSVIRYYVVKSNLLSTLITDLYENHEAQYMLKVSSVMDKGYTFLSTYYFF
jgi:hypothetical protein